MSRIFSMFFAILLSLIFSLSIQAKEIVESDNPNCKATILNQATNIKLSNIQCVDNKVQVQFRLVNQKGGGVMTTKEPQPSLTKELPLTFPNDFESHHCYPCHTFNPGKCNWFGVPPACQCVGC